MMTNLELTAEHERVINHRGHPRPSASFRLNRVDARGEHPHQHIAVHHDRQRHLAHFEALCAANSGGNQSAHPIAGGKQRRNILGS